jgi:hypothetical protein
LDAPRQHLAGKELKAPRVTNTKVTSQVKNEVLWRWEINSLALSKLLLSIPPKSPRKLTKPRTWGVKRKAKGSKEEGGVLNVCMSKMGKRDDWACSPMVGRSSGMLPTRVQILVLAPFPGFFQDLPALCVKW